MPDQADYGVVRGLKAVMERRSVTLAALSKMTDVPYRSLQNYFSKNVEMPVTVYLRICRSLDVEAAYPQVERFDIDHYALVNALISALGDAIPRSEFTEDGAMALVPNGDRARSEQDLKRDAGTLAVFIRSRYDMERERRLDEPVSSDEDA